PDADRARLYRIFAVGTKSILDALAGFRLQRARSVDQSEPCRRSDRRSDASPVRAQIATHAAVGKFGEALEHDREKACRGLDPGWQPVFGKDPAQKKNLDVTSRLGVGAACPSGWAGTAPPPPSSSSARSPAACPCWMSPGGWKTTDCRRR